MLNTHLLNKLINKKDDVEADQYADDVAFFFLERGIAYNEFKELPIPYIFKMLMSANRMRKKEEKDFKKMKKGK